VTAPIDLSLRGAKCTHWTGAAHCGSTDRVRPYNVGPRCFDCSPSAKAGETHPDEVAALARRTRAEFAQVAQ